MIRAVFGLFDRLGGKRRKEAQARKAELAGELDKAVVLFTDAELPEEAARVLLLLADAAKDAERRVVLSAQAARVGAGTEIGKQAARRKALLSFDLVRQAHGAPMHAEIRRAAEELAAAGEWERAVEAYRLVGDTAGEIRVLKDAGAIERLEEVLKQTSDTERKGRDRSQLLSRIRDLDTVAERREAVRCAREWLTRQADEQIQLELDRIVGRLVAGPIVNLAIDGKASVVVLGVELTLGRTRADILVNSTSVSRQHLRLCRDGAGRPLVEDLDTRNGTTLAGARVRGTLPVGEGLELRLAGEVDCRITPVSTTGGGDAVAIEVGGERYLAPLGPLRVGDWHVNDAQDGGERFVVVRTPAGREPPHMAGYRLSAQIELCVGDELTARRDGPVVLSVPDPSRRARAAS
jgi:pSer/pThr/pTyr-binding forkhead associated (FHA) protein